SLDGNMRYIEIVCLYNDVRCRLFDFGCLSIELGCLSIELVCLSIELGCLSIELGCLSIELGCLSIELGCLSIELGKKTNLQAGWSFCYLLFSISSTNRESSSHLSIFASKDASTSCCSLYRFCTFSKSLPASAIPV